MSTNDPAPNTPTAVTAPTSTAIAPNGETDDGAQSLAEAMAELAGLMLATSDLQELLSNLAALAARSAGPSSSCGITISPDGRAFTVATSDALAARVDEVQYANGDGPCLQSLRTGEVVWVPDLTVESRWGAYPAHALAEGVRCSLSLPMTVDGATVGALNLYSRAVDAFDDQDRRDGAVLAAGAAGAVGMALRLGHQVALSDQLRTALSSRAVIDQAVGIVIRDRRCSPEEAFAFLRTASQHRNVKLREVAAEMVASMSRKPVPGRSGSS